MTKPLMPDGGFQFQAWVNGLGKVSMLHDNLGFSYTLDLGYMKPGQVGRLGGAHRTEHGQRIKEQSNDVYIRVLREVPFEEIREIYRRAGNPQMPDLHEGLLMRGRWFEILTD